ncbi:MAG: TorF family putative porin [Pseudomonadota bacterium]
MSKLFKSALALLAVSTAVSAPAAYAEGEFSSNVALTTDYVWRGVSQNGENPAVQGGFDYANGIFYVGTWAANADVGGANLEWDIYGGLAGETEGGLSWDVGVIGYLYPDTDDLDFYEIYGGLGYGLTDNVEVGGYVYFDPDNESTYIEGTAGFAFTDAFGVDVSVGNYSFDGDGDYVNYSIGATLATEFVDFDLRFWGTDLDDTDIADDRIVLTVSRSM